MADQKFKTKVRLQGGASLPAETASRAPVIDASGNLVSSAVTSTELGHIAGLTSSAQAQITAAQTAASTAQTDINNHLSDAVDAHDASAISNIPAGSIAATDVQGALNEIDVDLTAAQTNINNLVTLSGVAANATNLGTFTGTIIPDSSTVKAALQSVETFVQALPDPMEYKGNYNAATNTPALADGTGNNGDVYYVNVAGTHNFGAGAITFAVGDRVVYSGSDLVWQKWDSTDSVTSVFGRMGAVVATSGDYTASQVTNVPAGTISSTTVQAALAELDGDVVAAASAASAAQSSINAHIAAASGAHAATAISNTPSGNLSSTTVQAALNELQSDINALAVASAGDINETSFAAANNQAAAVNVTGLAFAAGVTRGFRVLASVSIDATADTYETFELIGINKGGTFDMAASAVGDDTGVVFSITSGGQVQYTSASSAGFVSNTIKFRAQTTSV